MKANTIHLQFVDQDQLNTTCLIRNIWVKQVNQYLFLTDHPFPIVVHRTPTSLPITMTPGFQHLKDKTPRMLNSAIMISW